MSMRITTYRVPSGPAGTARTAWHMRSLILQGGKDMYVRRRAVRLLKARGVRPKDYLGEIRALFEWVRRSVRYTRDPYRVELLHSARRMIQLRAGDCDDMTILLGALLQSVGHQVRIVLAGPDAGRPGLFTHVYPEAEYRGRWIALDATMPHPMGWAPDSPVKKVVPLRTRISTRRGNAMNAAEMEEPLGQLPTGPAADLVEAVRQSGLPARDQRVRAVWDQLRAQGLLGSDPWVRQVLRRVWQSGLPPRPRPRTAARLEAALQSLGLSAGSAPGYPGPWGTSVVPGYYPAAPFYATPVRRRRYWPGYGYRPPYGYRSPTPYWSPTPYRSPAPASAPYRPAPASAPYRPAPAPAPYRPYPRYSAPRMR
ncbi:transglutaminase domain-containing protein [Streptomyces kanamyceticus]|uniref:Transglutaminase domain-containing protein n=2 Tax=Streptomyces kanamyceticus TaxID=1967 RepID=A0A5J6G760_STRKN|nr:transglutaminase-like domain-containing protein [Streptomyces kanamyceticus]QEU90454.1 transglutaminase domain-containing protein [Streptomyces kanamyceticus]